jgi:carboxymethylenebutenolidase
MKTETMDLSTANGDTSAYVALPDEPNGRGVLVIQEWWGVNEHVKDIVRRYAEEGFTAIAPDLYRGEVASDADTASKMMHSLELDDGIDTIKNAADKARERYNLQSIGITGYCMGGTFALRAAALVDGLKAAVPFYGDIPEEDVLKKLKVPTMFISGKRDQWISPEKVQELESVAAKHDLPLESVKYDADHAFFNDTRPEVYDESAANDAWKKAIDFFNANL